MESKQDTRTHCLRGKFLVLSMARAPARFRMALNTKRRAGRCKSSGLIPRLWRERRFLKQMQGSFEAGERPIIILPLIVSAAACAKL
jgi:hypothetical protein